MRYKDVIKYFGSAAKTARVLGYKHRQRVQKWKLKGIPTGDQALIEIATRGRLRGNLPRGVRMEGDRGVQT